MPPCLQIKESKKNLKFFLLNYIGPKVLNLGSVGTLAYISGLRAEILKIWFHILFLEHQMSIHAKVEPANTIIYWDIEKCQRCNASFAFLTLVRKIRHRQATGSQSCTSNVNWIDLLLLASLQCYAIFRNRNLSH